MFSYYTTFSYFLHSHSLRLGEKKDEDDGVCEGCKKCLLGQTYCCEKCKFYLHPSCAELPEEIDHFLHPCPLKLKIYSSFICNACYEARSGFAYCCQTCHVNMDPECILLPLIKSKGEEHIGHFSHLHPLILFRNMKDYEAWCGICGQLCSGSAFGCAKCNFFLHESCMEILPQKIKHFLHPCTLILLTTPSYVCGACKKGQSGLTFRCGKCNFELCLECCLMSLVKSDVSSRYQREIQHFFHPCPLILRIFSTFTCNACYDHQSDFAYYCELCDFYLDVECAQLPSITSEGEKEQIQHFSHWHPLKPFKKIEDYEVICEICGNFCQDLAYGCSPCKFYLHKSCMDILPQKIQNFLHPCPLILLTTAYSYQCAACDKNCSSGLKFHCGKCHLQLDIECALQPILKYEGNGKIKHMSHLHPLTHYPEKNVHHQFSCRACGKTCSSLIYGCITCNFFLHKSCAELPPEIWSFYHPSHPLILLNMISQNLKKIKCNFCLKDCHGFIFLCNECNFVLDVECASLKPTVESMIHTHTLTVVDNIYDELVCSACNISCINAPALRFLECNFNLHLVCGPLPVTIKHKCHVDPLTLKDFYVEDEDDDEFYELPRDPRLCVYCCETGCPMIADVKCVISEVIPALRGERGDVKLRTAGRQITSKVISKDLIAKQMEHNETDKEAMGNKIEMQSALSFYDIFRSLNAYEKTEISNIIAEMQLRMRRSRLSLTSKEEHTHGFSEEAFIRFMNSNL